MINIQVWLAPGMCIHRNILCGRNFEYFSEDPLITGKMAAAIVRGVQSHKNRACTIKHYACNNQELNRLNNNSMVSERVLREIYLRAFKIAIEEGKPICLMTSYNLINSTYSRERNYHSLIKYIYGKRLMEFIQVKGETYRILRILTPPAKNSKRGKTT